MPAFSGNLSEPLSNLEDFSRKAFPEELEELLDHRAQELGLVVVVHAGRAGNHEELLRLPDTGKGVLGKMGVGLLADDEDRGAMATLRRERQKASKASKASKEASLSLLETRYLIFLLPI